MIAPTSLYNSLDAFLASCPDMLFIATVDGALLQWSAALKQSIGPALAKQRFTEMVHPDDRGEIEDAWARVVKTADPIALRIRLPAARGGHVRFRCVLRLALDGGIVHGSLGEDIVPPEELGRLRQKEQILNALMDNVPVCVWAIDAQGTFTYYDGKGLEIAGLKRNQLLGQNLFEVYGDDVTAGVRDALAGVFAHAFAEQHGGHWESWFVPVRDDAEATSGVIGLTLDVSAAKRLEEELRAQLTLVQQQQQVIRDLSTPIIEVWDGVLTLPMVGVVDSVRVSEVTEALLLRIVEKNARFAILDLTGVEMVDTRVASHLIGIISAIRLLGAEGIVTGIRPTVAQTMVALGLDLSSVVTRANLHAGLSFCIRRMAASARPSPGGSA